MLATKALFPYQSFQGDHTIDYSDEEEASDESDEDAVAASLFCLASEDPDIVEEHLRNDATRNVTKGIKRLDGQLVATLPVYWRWVVKAFAEVAQENALVFETATNHDNILSEFKEAPHPDNSRATNKLGKFWKAGTYGEITCPAVDIIAVCRRSVSAT